MQQSHWSSVDELGPEYKLVWPPEIFKEEANSILTLIHPDSVAKRGRVLLAEAFEDEAVVRDFDSAGGISTWIATTSTMSQNQFLIFLIQNADALHHRTVRNACWLERNGIEVPQEEAREDSLQEEFVALVRELIAAGYFSKLAHKSCVDDQDSKYDTSEQLDRLVSKYLGVPRLWSRSKDEILEADYLYSLMEVFHDLVSRPTEWSYHDFADCGPHFSEFSLSTGRKVFRWRVNDLLKKHKTGLIFAESGENKGHLIHTSADPRQAIKETATSYAAPDAVNTIEHAIALFERRGANREQKRSACVALALVLESRRKLVKKNMLSADEGLLFEMANKFDLRHRDGKQHDEYADDFLDWIFWIFLSTVELTNRLIQNQANGLSTP